MSFTSDTEEQMRDKGYYLTVVDGINVYFKSEGLIFDEEAYIDYSIKPWISRCEARGIQVDPGFVRKTAEEQGGMVDEEHVPETCGIPWMQENQGAGQED